VRYGFAEDTEIKLEATPVIEHTAGDGIGDIDVRFTVSILEHENVSFDFKRFRNSKTGEPLDPTVKFDRGLSGTTEQRYSLVETRTDFSVIFENYLGKDVSLANFRKHRHH